MPGAALCALGLLGGCSASSTPQAAPLPTPVPSTTARLDLSRLTHAQPAAVLPGAGSCTGIEPGTWEGRDHLEQGREYRFKAFPPTSGPHDEVVLPAGVYDEELTEGPAGADEPTWLRAVHSLEHGYVVVLHHGLSPAELTELTEDWKGRKKVIIAPSARLDTKVTLVAWGHLRSCDTVDPEAVAHFVSVYREGPTSPEPEGV